jgi:uridine kinase
MGKRAAVLISGYLRAVKNNLESLRNQVIGKFEKCDVYLHITSNESSEDRYFNPISRDDIESIKSFLSPRVVVEGQNLKIVEQRRANDLINSWTKYQSLLSFMKEIEEIEGEYDVVVKYRPDTSLIDEIPFELIDLNESVIYIPSDSKIDVDKLLNRNDPYVCDIFAFGSSSAMKSYFPTLERSKDLIARFGAVPETFLYHHLESCGTKYEQVDIEYSIVLSNCNVFAIVGDSGSGKSTLASLLKKNFTDSFLLECDRYHKWERGDEMWKKMTHLNPESNLLAKMRNDIFDLKIGNDVYHVNYDHKTGKFTDQEHIQSKSNVIVCGLHSLLVDDNGVYNSSIFMDTDEALRKKWKIRRDTKKRGYTKFKVMEQINDRRHDYEEYIIPQRSKAEIIINFYTDEIFDIENVDELDSVGLRVFVRKNHEISKTLDKLRSISKSQFKHEIDEEYHIVEFPISRKIEYDDAKMLELYSYATMIILDVSKS